MSTSPAPIPAPTPDSSRRRHTGLLQVLASSALAVAVACAAAIVPTASAEAAEVPRAITAIRTTDATLVDGSITRVEIEWSVPDKTPRGSTFTLTLPPEFSAMTTGFPLMSGTTPAVPVATAVVSGRTVTFTLTDYAETHTKVSGTAYFEARFSSAIGEGEVVSTVFYINSTAYPVKVVGGAPGVGQPEGPQPYAWKWGTWDISDGVPYHWWAINTVQGPWTQTTIVDTLGAGQSMRCDTISVYEYKVGVEGALRTAQRGADYTVSCTPAGFTLQFVKPTPADVFYRVFYDTNITDASVTAFTNSAAIYHDTKLTTLSETAQAFDAGGNGNGLQQRTLSVTKTLDGSGAATATGPFVIDVDCVTASGGVVGGFPTSLTFTAAATQTLTVPAGAVCSAEETDAGGATRSVVSPSTVAITSDAADSFGFIVTNTFATGDLAVTKTVTGDGKALLPANQRYDVDYSYTVAGVVTTGTLTVADGETAELAGLPTGTVVTLTEVEPESVHFEGGTVMFGIPVFEVAGTSAPTATVTIGEETTVAVALTNPTTVGRVLTAVTTPTPTPTTTTGTTPTVSPALASSLASTGTEALPFIGGALALLLAGVALLATRRRATRR